MKFFAVIPAAGASVRMGQDKLLLPWGDRLVVEATLAAWTASQVDHTVITVRSDQPALSEVCRRAGAIVAPAATPPADMKASVLIALDLIERQFAPEPCDAWLTAPADIPLLSTEAIDALISVHRRKIDRRQPAAILTPLLHGRRGHPVLFPWSMVHEARSLPEDSGLNHLAARWGSEAIDVSELVSSTQAFADIDTPQEYDALRPDRPSDRDG